MTERLAELERWDRNRREQRSIRTSINANRGLNTLLKGLGKSLGVLGVAIEAPKFNEALKKCECEAKGDK